MKTITDDKYKEYLSLKRWAKREKVYQSVSSIQNLEEDIDAPIKKCVAMFALLGLHPLFSCCGFDYHGQPFHKSHQYGEPYFMFSLDNESKKWLDFKGAGWFAKKYIQGTMLIENKVKGNPYWRKKDCIHFAEECNISIAMLEKHLFSMSEWFKTEVVLEDTNHNYKKSGIRFWQYPAKNPWVIRKDLLGTY